MLYVGTRVELEESFTDHAVVIEHKKDAPTTDSSVLSDNLHVVYLMVGEVIDGMGIDREVKAVIVTLFIDEDVLARGIREGEEVRGHVAIAFVERIRRMDACFEEDKVFGEIPRGTEAEGDDEDGEKGELGTGL